MFLISKPSEETIRRFIEAQKDKPFSYTESGLTREADTPPGFTADHNRIQLGTGRAVFERAVEALRRWKMFELSWTELFFADTPIESGQTVALLISHFGFHSLNAARTVYVLEEINDTTEKYGFAYGTLPEHNVRGEERFSVEYRKQDESVWYDIHAVSQPNSFLAKIGYPIGRYFQKKFAAESKSAMLRAAEK